MNCRLGDDVKAKGKKGVVVKIVSDAKGIVGVGVYLKPWSQWDEEWAKGWIPKVHMFTLADITRPRLESMEVIGACRASQEKPRIS